MPETFTETSNRNKEINQALIFKCIGLSQQEGRERNFDFFIFREKI